MGRFIYDAYSYTPCNVIVYVSMLRNSLHELECSNSHSVKCCQSVIDMFPTRPEIVGAMQYKQGHQLSPMRHVHLWIPTCDAHFCR